MTAVSLRGVSFGWKGSPPFQIEVPDWQIEEGETVLLLGGSGSGKSTLLNLVCGLHQPDRGEIHVDGKDIAALRASHRDRFRADRFGVIFQTFNLLPYATPLDNILLALRFSRQRRTRITGNPAAAALRLTASLGLPEQLMRFAPAAHLSVGQQQRVAVARALIGTPALVVADEPTSALDAESQAGFLDLLFEQVRASGCTLLMVSHDQRLADRFDRCQKLTDISNTSRALGA